MRRDLFATVLALFVFPLFLHGQGGKFVIPAGTPEDQALQAAGNEQDAVKRLAMYQDFVQKFASNPIAAGYGNWQIAQYYQAAGDSSKALESGDKALAAVPGNLDLLVFQTNVAQQLKDTGKIVDYATRGGTAYQAANKTAPATEATPQEASGERSSSRLDEEKAADKSSYEFLEAAAYAAIANETDPTSRMAHIEKFTPAFPGSKYADQITSYAMVALTQLNDMPRLVTYGEKTLAADPNNLPTLMLLASAYVDDPKAGSTAKAITYAQKAIAVAKADAPDADKARKISAGVAHSTLGYAYMKQEKTGAAIPELKAATVLLKEQSDQEAIALYRLGFAYAKLARVTEARAALMEAVRIPGPVQKPAQDLLLKVNAARAQGR